MKLYLLYLGIVLITGVLSVYFNGYYRHQFMGEDKSGKNQYQHAWHIRLPGYQTYGWSEHTINPDETNFAGSCDQLFEAIHTQKEGYSWITIDGNRVRHRPAKEWTEFVWGGVFYRVGPWYDGTENERQANFLVH